MSGLLAIAGREIRSFFRLPLGWVVIALFLTLSGAVFALGTLTPGEPATLRPFFQTTNWVMMFLAPAISMRLLSEERRSGTIEPLMTAPVSDWQIVAGKFLGGWGFLLIMLAPTLAYVLALEGLSDPEYGPVLTGYVGLAALGGVYIAVGLLFSAMTANQTLSFLGTLFLLLLARLATLQGAQLIGPPWDQALLALSIDLRMADFAKGLIDTAHLVFFGAVMLWFVTLSVVAVESRRWR